MLPFNCSLAHRAENIIPLLFLDSCLTTAAGTVAYLAVAA
jgi:hypothetical protein